MGLRTSQNIFVVNPLWRDAIYEQRWLTRTGYLEEKFPVRGNEIKDGKIVPIPALVTPEEAVRIETEIQRSKLLSVLRNRISVI